MKHSKSQVKYVKKRGKICNNALLCFLSQTQAKIMCSYCSAGSFPWSTHGCLFPVCDTLHIHKILILSLVLEILWMKNSFIIPREILQPEIQRPLEITWVAAEEKHLMGKGEGRGLMGKIKAWRKHAFEKQVKRIKTGRKVISSLVQLGSFDCVRGATSPAPVQDELVPDEGSGTFPEDFTKCWIDLGRSPHCTGLACKF